MNLPTAARRWCDRHRCRALRHRSPLNASDGEPQDLTDVHA
jgi:hypothetical protein